MALADRPVHWLLTVFWLLVLVILPNFTMFGKLFRPYLPVVEMGGPKDVYSFDNYMPRSLAARWISRRSASGFQLPVRVKVFL